MTQLSELLTPEEVRHLRGRSDLVGAALVLHGWATIAGAMALFAWWPNALTLLVGVAVIGTRQLGLAILMHDAAHGLLFASRRLNDGLSQWLCAFPVATDLGRYRPYHMKHHRFTQQAEDPDLSLSKPFPITRQSLWRKIGRDLAGITAYQRRRQQIRAAMGPKDLPLGRRLGNLWRVERGTIIANLALFAGLAAIGHWYLYPLLWLLPLATWYQLVSRIRNIAEHAMVPSNDDPLRNTRTTHAGWIERAFIAPYWVNYHLEHHLFLFVPCWRLDAAHRLLRAKGFAPRMEVRGGYLEVLKLATSALSDGPRDGLRGRATQHI